MKAQCQTDASPEDLNATWSKQLSTLTDRVKSRQETVANLSVEDQWASGRHPQPLSFSGHETNPFFLQTEPGHFMNATAPMGLAYTRDGRALAHADLDGDGDQDLILRNAFSDPLVLLRNRASPKGASIIVTLEASDCNRNGIGATIRIGNQIRRIVCGDSYLTCSPAEAHFGLGDAERVESMEIQWPCGRRQVVADVPVNGRVIIREGDTAIDSTPFRPPTTPVSPDTVRTFRVGDTLELDVETLDGKKLPPSTRPALVHVWSAKARSCGRDLRGYARIAGELDGLDFISLNIDAELTEHRSKMTDRKFPVPVWIGHSLRKQLSHPTHPILPVAYVIDRERRVIAKHVGSMGHDELISWAREKGALQ